MLELETGLDPETREQLNNLETRVARLERALAQGLGGIGAKPDECAITQKLVALKSEAELLRTRPMKILASPSPAERADTLDRLGITGSFASLDARLAEAAHAESEIQRKQDTFAPVMVFDEALIDRATAKPPPEKIEVFAHLEERHPNILKKICMLWRTPELDEFLARLIVDDRGTRAGFEPGVMTELLLLNALLDAADDPDRWRANARAI